MTSKVFKRCACVIVLPFVLATAAVAFAQTTSNRNGSASSTTSSESGGSTDSSSSSATTSTLAALLCCAVLYSIVITCILIKKLHDRKTNNTKVVEPKSLRHQEGSSQSRHENITLEENTENLVPYYQSYEPEKNVLLQPTKESTSEKPGTIGATGKPLLPNRGLSPNNLQQSDTAEDDIEYEDVTVSSDNETVHKSLSPSYRQQTLKAPSSDPVKEGQTCQALQVTNTSKPSTLNSGKANKSETSQALKAANKTEAVDKSLTVGPREESPTDDTAYEPFQMN